jgi:hypothetical protein
MYYKKPTSAARLAHRLVLPGEGAVRVTVDEADGDAVLASGYKSSLVTIQESLKWLIAAAGATAAFVVGGLQLHGVPAGDQQVSVFRGCMLVAAAVVGVGVVIGLLFWTAFILTLPRITASELIRREQKAGVPLTGPEPGKIIKDTLVKWVLDQRTYLLGDAHTIQDLYVGQFVRAGNALSAMRKGTLKNWNCEAVDPSDAASLLHIRESIQDTLNSGQRQLVLVEDAVHFERTRSAYRVLTKWLWGGAAVLVVSIMVFAFASRLPDPPVRITQPVPVEVIVHDRGVAGLPPGCTSNELSGVAVDGRLRGPTVVVDGPESCRGTVIDDGHGVVVIPKPSKTDSGLAPPAPDSELASRQKLRQLADSDRPFVSAQLADRWVPQISSKRPGVVDEGVVWDNQTTLQEHLLLRQRYNARLLWSGDWSTFDAPDFWITVVPITFATSDAALEWCDSQGLTQNRCYAKLISTTHGPLGSTAYN